MGNTETLVLVAVFMLLIILFFGYVAEPAGYIPAWINTTYLLMGFTIFLIMLGVAIARS